MDEGLIQNWNDLVGPKDIIYILGDVFFCNEERAISIASRLPGRKIWLPGNHDKRIVKSEALQRKIFDEVIPPLYETYIDKIKVVMCHYPILSWNARYHGSFHLHGHVHGGPEQKMNIGTRRYDVGVDANGYAPVPWETIKSKLEKVDVKGDTEY
jgi:calcineurin-like phosphoesterase family protein